MENAVAGQAKQGLDVFEEVRRAIVVVAHGDDMETMMGSTIWLLAQRGVEFYQVICTQGDLGSNDEKWTRESLSAVRRDEAVAGGQALGLRETVTLDYHDGELEPSLELRAQLAGFYRRWQPDTLFTFDPSWGGQVHPDHRAAGRAAVDAFMPSKMRLYRPEQLAGAKVANVQRAFLFGAGNPTIFVDISEVYDKKVAAALEHRSQFPAGDKALDWMRDLDRAAARTGGLPGEYAEQFAPLRVW